MQHHPEMRTYVVTIKAFGRERVLKVEAQDRHEAITRAKTDIGYSCKVEPYCFQQSREKEEQ